MRSILIQPGPPALLLVEGKTAQVFFTAFLKALGKADGEPGVKIIDFGGVSQLRGTLQRVVDPEFRAKGKAIAVIRDAERDAAAAYQSVSDALRSVGLEVPPQSGRWAAASPATGVFILPDNLNSGMIESLCLAAIGETAAGQTQIACAEAFLDCLGASANASVANLTKAKMLSILAGTGADNPQVGAAARAKYFSWDAATFAPLRQFLGRL
jgi:hypothetical protein